MYTRDIKQWILSLKEEEIVLAKDAYQKYFTQMKEATFYQLLARLNSEKYIAKIAKGLYYKPFKDDFERLPSQDKLLNFFTNKNKNGMIVGANMLKMHDIISNSTETYDVYTNLIEIKTTRYMSNLAIKYVNVDFKNTQVTSLIETLELIEIIDDFKDVNYENLYNFLKKFAESYNEDNLYKVLVAKSYKKRNVASLKKILDYFHVDNNLSRVLNTASKYNFPENIKKALSL